MSDTPTLSWLTQEGPHPALVVSSRVRLARNLVEHPFRGSNSSADREAVILAVDNARNEIDTLRGSSWHRLAGASEQSRLWLHEHQLASRELAGLAPRSTAEDGAAVLVGNGTAVMCNEEDHIRIQAFSAGFALDRAHADAARIGSQLGHRICFAFHPEFGYLTGCPTNVGTGLRASVLIHLPALVLTNEIGRVMQGLAQIGMTYRGLWGEGSVVRGDLFQLSNQVTLGKPEHALLEHISRIVVEVMGHEARARDILRLDSQLRVEDRVWRAWGMLNSARWLSFEEYLDLASGVRLGVGMGFLPRVGWTTMNRLLVDAQDAHVARSTEIGLDDEALPIHRATMVRRTLAEEVRG